MYKTQVGELYQPNRRSWPEGGQYNFRGGGHERLLSFRNTTKSEIEAVRTGEAEFALAVFQPVLFLLFRFGTMPWSGAPYTIHLVPESERKLPEPEATAETRALLRTVLMEATTGIVKALRAFTFSPEFTRRLHEGIRKQAGLPWNEAEYDAKLESVYRQYSSTVRLLSEAVVRCRGGE